MSDATTPRLKVSREGVVLIKSFEGFRPHAVRMDDGRWIIGYGHTVSAREGLSVGEQDAELLLQYDLLPVVGALNERAPSGLNQHQFDALASFAISVGVDRFLASDVLQRLNEGQAGLAADALIGWPETASPADRLRRRAAERALFVADPGAPVTLADLLAAPLPPPQVHAETSAPQAGAINTPAAPLAPAAAPTGLGSAVLLNRYSPYAAAIIGPLPGFEATKATPTDVAAAEEPSTAVVPEQITVKHPIPSQATVEAPPRRVATELLQTSPVIPLVSPGPVTSPFPPLDEPLVLTPLTEADLISTERLIWHEEDRSTRPAPGEAVLFEDEPPMSVLRHEVEPSPARRFDWSETGAFLIMGGVGLAACAASAAAFRLAVEQPSPMGETSVIAWALALIGAICVGVSSWNLYVRWGKPD